jgi:putative hemolysin
MDVSTQNTALDTVVEPLSESDGRYQVSIATTLEEVQASQKMRDAIFAEEQGAVLHTTTPGLDADELDPYCMHLLVRDSEKDCLVASTRVLNDEKAALFGRFYSESEFEMDAVKALEGRKLEIGRTCVHADYRNGAVIGALWQGLVELMYRDGYQWLFGCASIPLEDGGSNLHAIMDRFRRKYMCDESYRVTPRVNVPAVADDQALTALRIPPLLKAYVSLGAHICGEPSWDEDFNVADVFVLLNVDNLSTRYVRHFARSQQ